MTSLTLVTSATLPDVISHLSIFLLLDYSEHGSVREYKTNRSPYSESKTNVTHISRVLSSRNVRSYCTSLDIHQIGYLGAFRSVITSRFQIPEKVGGGSAISCLMYSPAKPTIRILGYGKYFGWFYRRRPHRTLPPSQPYQPKPQKWGPMTILGCTKSPFYKSDGSSSSIHKFTAGSSKRFYRGNAAPYVLFTSFSFLSNSII